MSCLFNEMKASSESIWSPKQISALVPSPGGRRTHIFLFWSRLIKPFFFWSYAESLSVFRVRWTPVCYLCSQDLFSTLPLALLFSLVMTKYQEVRTRSTSTSITSRPLKQHGSFVPEHFSVQAVLDCTEARVVNSDRLILHIRVFLMHEWVKKSYFNYENFHNAPLSRLLWC